MFSFHNPILLESISTTSLKEDPMLFVEKESITLSEFFGIVTPNGLNFSIRTNCLKREGNLCLCLMRYVQVNLV